MKSLIIEAYHMGQQELLYIIPFVSKILESCGKSKVKRKKVKEFIYFILKMK